MRRKAALFFFILNTIWIFVGVININIPPHVLWPSGFVALSLPFALIANIFFLFLWGARKSLLVVLPLILVLFFWSYYKRGFTLHFGNNVAAEEIEKLKVLSYNVRIFNTYAHLFGEESGTSEKMISWVAENDADVICLQEFYNEKKSKIYNSLEKIAKRKGKFHFVSRTLVNHIGADFGMAIISKYPIINKGTIQFGKLTQNHAMFVDLKVNKDTIRVYNFHLQSMSIEAADIEASYKDQANFKIKGRLLSRQLKKGFQARSLQVKMLLEHFEGCQYPMLVCGDMNDVPYSYTYEKLNSRFSNTFATYGYGIGATYNGKIPFLRIDHQFYSDHFTVHDFTTHYEIPYSDHFPISAVYSLKK